MGPNTRWVRGGEQGESPVHVVGAYSPAVKAGPYLFISGQIPVNPKTGELIAGDIRAQTNRVMQNIEMVLEQYQLSFTHIVQARLFLTHLEHFSAVNEVYSAYFKKPFPARSCVVVKDLPKNAGLEIETTAFFP